MWTHTELKSSLTQEKYEEALREVDKAFGLGLTEADLYLCRGRAYIGLQRYEQAVRDLDEAIALGLKEPVVYDGRGFAHFELGHYQCAKKDFDEAIRLGLEEARAWWGESGEEHLYESNDPLRYSMAGVYFFRGQTHLELSDYEKAVSDFNESKKLALTACVRKLLVILNSMLRHGLPWRDLTPKVAGHCS